MTNPPTITYLRTISNARDLWVDGDRIQVEDRPPEEGGQPITVTELALVEEVRREKGWTAFGICQTGRFAWTKDYNPIGAWPSDHHMRLDRLIDELKKTTGGTEP